MNTEILQFILLSIGLPVAICAVATWFSWRPSPGIGTKAATGHWGGITGFALGYLVAHWAVNSGLPTTPWSQTWESWQGLFYLALAALVIGLIDSFVALRPWQRWGLALLFTVLCAWLLIPGWQEDVWYWRTLVATIVLLLWGSLDHLAERNRGATVPLVLTIAAAGASVLVVLCGVNKFGQLLGAVSAMCGISFAISWRRRELSLARGPILIVAASLVGFMANAHLDNAYNSDYQADQGYIPLYCFAAVLLAPNLAWLAGLGVIRNRTAWLVATVVAVLVAIPVAIALWIAVGRWQMVSGGF